MSENEFENILDDDSAGDDVVSSTGSNTLVSVGDSGEVYDWSTAPEGVKAPPRELLDGKTVTLKKADIILPPSSREWARTRDGSKQYKYCTFTLFYDNGQQESVSGVRVFNRDGKYSHPTITRDRQSQASKLFGIYADYKKKNINEVSLREFMAFLNSHPKCKIVSEEVKNPSTGAIIKKNLIGAFL